MMLARFLGDGDVVLGIPQPCHVFGLEFPVGEWVMVENAAHALKLAANPLFETDGEAPEAPVSAEREPEPDPGADGDPEPDDKPPEVSELDRLRGALKARGVSFHHKAGVESLTKLLAESA
jgi:hypothetical protein